MALHATQSVVPPKGPDHEVVRVYGSGANAVRVVFVVEPGAPAPTAVPAVLTIPNIGSTHIALPSIATVDPTRYSLASIQYGDRSNDVVAARIRLGYDDTDTAAIPERRRDAIAAIDRLAGDPGSVLAVLTTFGLERSSLKPIAEAEWAARAVARPVADDDDDGADESDDAGSGGEEDEDEDGVDKASRAIACYFVGAPKRSSSVGKKRKKTKKTPLQKAAKAQKKAQKKAAKAQKKAQKKVAKAQKKAQKKVAKAQKKIAKRQEKANRAENGDPGYAEMVQRKMAKAEAKISKAQDKAERKRQKAEAKLSKAQDKAEWKRQKAEAKLSKAQDKAEWKRQNAVRATEAAAAQAGGVDAGAAPEESDAAEPVKQQHIGAPLVDLLAVLGPSASHVGRPRDYDDEADEQYVAAPLVDLRTLLGSSDRNVGRPRDYDDAVAEEHVGSIALAPLVDLRTMKLVTAASYVGAPHATSSGDGMTHHTGGRAAQWTSKAQTDHHGWSTSATRGGGGCSNH
jgi:hypothetical protein